MRPLWHGPTSGRAPRSPSGAPDSTLQPSGDGRAVAPSGTNEYALVPSATNVGPVGGADSAWAFSSAACSVTVRPRADSLSIVSGSDTSSRPATSNVHVPEATDAPRRSMSTFDVPAVGEGVVVPTTWPFASRTVTW